MSLDPLTIFVATMFVTGLCGFLLLYSWLLNRNTTALALWATGYLMASIGTALVIARDVIPNLWSIEISNALIAFAYGLVWSGARSFDDRRTPVSLVLTGAVIWLVACQVEAIYASPQARAMLMSAIICGYTVLCAWEFWRARDKGLKSRWPIIVFLLLHAVVYLTRTLHPGLLPFATSAQDLAGLRVVALAFEWMFVAVCAAFLLTHLARERAELCYKQASVIDPLTGVANRRAFVEEGGRLLRRMGVERRDAALLSFDLDRFKQINDTFGHAAGDRALCTFCDVATSTLRPGDLFGRLGGEEFAGLLPHITLLDALQVAERIRAQVAATPGAGLHATTVSIGVAMSTETNHDLARLMVAADRALYRAKAKGGNCVEPTQSPFVPCEGGRGSTRPHHSWLATRTGTKRAHIKIFASSSRLLANFRLGYHTLLANMPPQFSSIANKELRDANRRLDTALNNMSQGLCMFDSEGRLVLCNERYIQMYRLSHDAVKPGCTIRELLALRKASGTFLGDPDEYGTKLRARIAEGKAFHSIVEAVDGLVTVIVDQPIEGGGWVATFEDITERRRVEHERDRSQKFLNTILENAPIPIFVKEASGLRYVLVNRAGEKFWGTCRAEMIGKTSHDVFPKEEADLIAARDRQLLQSDQPFFDERQIHTPRNGVRSIVSKKLTVCDDDGKSRYVVGVIEDVTERKDVEKRIAHMAHQVIHLNRIAIAGVLSASFAHELNQPLGSILSNAEAAEVLLAANPLDLGQFREILANIRRDDQRAGEIIKQLGGLLKKGDEIELQEFDLNDAVRCALHLLDHEAMTRDVVLGIRQAQAALPVCANVVHVQQVILNLAMNGMDAMLYCDPGSRKLTLETALVGDTDVEVSVSDSGTGILADKIERIFDTFVTTKQQGTGLGLSIARTIIETYGGKIWAENRLAGGAVFRFTLPLAKAQAA